MSSLNKIQIIGRLGADPEAKKVKDKMLCRMSVATTESWKDDKGQVQERTEWHRVCVWGKLGEICVKYLEKGRRIYLEGRLQTRSWEDEDNITRYTTEVIANEIKFLDSGDRPESSNSSYRDQYKDEQMGGDSDAFPF